MESDAKNKIALDCDCATAIDSTLYIVLFMEIENVLLSGVVMSTGVTPNSFITPLITSGIIPGGGASSVTERLVQAVEHIKDYTTERGSLIQLWVPVSRGGKRVLTTKEQPFSHDPLCQRLANYREISVNYHFSAEQDDSKALAGLPGRVFLGKLPEWTPDVRFFRSEEYPRVQHAQDCGVRGTLAIRKDIQVLRGIGDAGLRQAVTCGWRTGEDRIECRHRKLGGSGE